MLLNELDALPLLTLTLAVNEFTGITITVFLALSFSHRNLDSFVTQMLD